MNCHKCGFEMESGYSAANSSLSWIEKEKFQSFCFVDEDRNEPISNKLSIFDSISLYPSYITLSESFSSATFSLIVSKAILPRNH